MSRRIWIHLVVVFVVCTATALGQSPLTLQSPDGRIEVDFELKSNPQPYLPGERAYYRVSYDDHVVLGDSPLGLDVKDGAPLDHDFEILQTTRRSYNSSWENPLGARRDVPDRYSELAILLRERQAPTRLLEIIFRAYNEGVAFRYFLPPQGGMDPLVVSAENTGFYFNKEATAFALRLDSFVTAYESHYDRVALNQIKPESIVGLPLLVQIPHGPWVALLEADLFDYAGMYVGGVAGAPNALQVKLSPVPSFDLFSMGPYEDQVVKEHDLGKTAREARNYLILSPPGEGHNLLPPPRSIAFGPSSQEIVVSKIPKATPWRVLLMSSRPGGLIENNYLVLNLSRASLVGDTSWITPGKAAWDWWSGRMDKNVNFTPGMNTATMEHYIDFAAAHHLEYMLIDGGWSPFNDITISIPEIDMPAIRAHAKAKGVKVLLWALWTAVRDQADLAFPLYEKWGVAGVKIDFMDRDDQEMVKWYEEIAREAAEHHLVVDFHGAFKPTGLRRTYPNVLTREGVLGLEQDKSNNGASPDHDVTLAFTRMLAGPLDYTPGAFHNATREQFKPQNIEPSSQGTRAHQLAMYVVYESPLAMVSDYPEAYEGAPEFEFIEKVPTVWDETKVLNGEPPNFVTIARRRGKIWYVGSMTNWDARDIEIPLNFLGAGEYRVKSFADGLDADRLATQVSIHEREVTHGEHLMVHLAPGGGWAAIISPTSR